LVSSWPRLVAIDTVASLIMGKIADNWGPHIVALTGGFCQLSVMVAYFIGLKFVSGTPCFRHDHSTIVVKWFHDYSYLLYLTAGVWAIGDAAFNLFPNYVMSVLFTDNAEAAFATLKFFQVNTFKFPLFLIALGSRKCPPVPFGTAPVFGIDYCLFYWSFDHRLRLFGIFAFFRPTYQRRFSPRTAGPKLSIRPIKLAIDFPEAKMSRFRIVECEP
jgi:hypothetical protein